MPTIKPRYSVLIPDDISRALRARVTAQYPDIPGITEATTPNLIRFVVLINAGLPVDIARRGLSNFTRRGVNFDNPPD